MTKVAYNYGVKDAMLKFALSPLPLPGGAKGELAGLALLQIPAAYELYHDFKHHRPLMDKMMHGAELAGLGWLSNNELRALRQGH